ncbi:hypothetical protein ACFL4L_05715 [bacterium]
MNGVQQKLGVDQIKPGVEQLNQVMLRSKGAVDQSVDRSESCLTMRRNYGLMSQYWLMPFNIWRENENGGSTNNTLNVNNGMGGTFNKYGMVYK